MGSQSGNKSFVDGLKKNLEKKTWSVRTITALVLFGAIILVFVFFGYSTKHDAGGQGYAARVNDSFVSLTDLNAETQRMEQFYASLFGGQLPPGARRQDMQGQALENLISQELMAQGATQQKIVTSDSELRDFIINEMPVFQEGGKFRRDRYEAILQANQWTPGMFEARMRKERQIQKVRRILEAGLEPLKLENEKTAEMNRTQLNLQFVRMEAEGFFKKNPVTDAQANERLAQPEFKKKVAEEFQVRKSELDRPAEVHASHILIKVGGDMTEQKALSKISEIRKKALSGDFAKLAKEFSQDQGSKDKGGDLGTFRQGRMVPEFEKVAFEIPLNQISEPVKTQFGYHLIKVSERKPEVQATLEKFELEVAKTLISHERFQDAMKQMEASLEKGDTKAIEDGLKVAQLSWEETGYFGLGSGVVPKIGNPEVSNSLSDLMKTKSYLPKVLREGNVAYLVKFKDLKMDDSAKATPEQMNASRQRVNEVLGTWVEDAKKSAVVERHLNIQLR